MGIPEELLKRINKNSLYKITGIQIEEAGEGRARSRLESNPKLCWPVEGQVHGGVLFTLMDTTMATAVFSKLDRVQSCTTVHIDIQFTYPARGEVFTCTTEESYRTGRMSFVRGEIHDAQRRLVALGQGTFRIIREEFKG